ncbi:MAG: hypothetical protein NTZ46_11030 [Verrucomicrobia bacterium]|nr:hypothetical protein [Verrucomicrobiota bacterium]
MRKLALLCFVSLASLEAQESPAPVVTAPATPGTGGAPVAPPFIAPVPALPLAPVEAAPPAANPAIPSAAAETAAPALAPSARRVHDIQGEEAATILRLLARQAGINVVVSDQILGTINMRLENMTPLEAIKVIVEAKGLEMSQSNNVFFIKTAAEKAKEPTESGSYTFSYAKAPEALALITTQIQSGIAPQIDVRTNTVFYRDYKSNMPNLALFFESIDCPTQQVMIEARLVEVNANPKQSYGINWAGTLGGSQAAQTFRYAGGGLTVDKAISSLDPLTGKIVSNNGTILSDLLLNGRGMQFGDALAGQFAILSVPQMSATLRLMNEDTDTEFLANPRVVTANNLKADIKITRKQPVPKLNFNEQTATAVFSGFDDKEYGNTLSVTPTINKDNFVTMLVKPEISVTTPVIDTRSLESNVLIKSGDTLAIGGLLQDENSKTRAKVPVLGDIPVLGYLFQEHVNARTKRNLLVFITPTIIKQGYGTGLENQISGLKNSGEEFADPNGWRNNARGAVRIVPTSNRPIVADYPKPGTAPAPVRKGNPNFKVTVPAREQ